eukprot:8226214-Pyramimonas_sp.AAC.1
MLHAACFWVSIAGGMAADGRADIPDEKVTKQADKIQLYLAAHDVIEVPNGGIHCLRCLRTACSSHTKAHVWARPCVPKPCAPSHSG